MLKIALILNELSVCWKSAFTVTFYSRSQHSFCLCRVGLGWDFLKNSSPVCNLMLNTCRRVEDAMALNGIPLKTNTGHVHWEINNHFHFHGTYLQFYHEELLSLSLENKQNQQFTSSEKCIQLPHFVTALLEISYWSKLLWTKHHFPCGKTAIIGKRGTHQAFGIK